MRIYLIGYMGSGKSNMGKTLAEHLGFDFADLDCIFEERFKIGILDFFDKYDEKGFRQIERSLLLETTCWSNVVIATGGGTPCFFDNMDVIRRSGISVYLHWDLEPLMVRLKQAKRKRPLLKDIPMEELRAHVREQIRQREVFYSQADIVFEAADPDMDALVCEIRKRLIP